MSNQYIHYTNDISLPTALNKAKRIFWISQSSHPKAAVQQCSVVISLCIGLHSQKRPPYPSACSYSHAAFLTGLAQVFVWPSGELDKEKKKIELKLNHRGWRGKLVLTWNNSFPQFTLDTETFVPYVNSRKNWQPKERAHRCLSQ